MGSNPTPSASQAVFVRIPALPMRRYPPTERTMAEEFTVTDVKVIRTEGAQGDRAFNIEVTAGNRRVSLLLHESVASKLQAQLHALDLTPPGLSDLKRLS